MDKPFTQSARYYDRIYSFKNYAAEAEKLIAIIEMEPDLPCTSLLDVACGTGAHLELLKPHFQIEGLDLSPEMLAIARKRHPELTFHEADMTDFALGRQFDLITCLFSSIAHTRSIENLRRAIRCMAEHLNPSGRIIIEPWFTPATFKENTVHSLYIDDPELKIARVNTSRVEGRVSVLDMHHLVGTPEQTVHFVEHHELGLFETDEMIAAMEGAGLAVTHDSDGLMGRGLFVGQVE